MLCVSERLHYRRQAVEQLRCELSKAMKPRTSKTGSNSQLSQPNSLHQSVQKHGISTNQLSKHVQAIERGNFSDDCYFEFKRLSRVEITKNVTRCRAAWVCCMQLGTLTTHRAWCMPLSQIRVSKQFYAILGSSCELLD